MIPSRLGGLVRQSHLWLPGYLATRFRRWGEPPPRRAWLTIADHFEPRWLGADPSTACDRVALWRRHWPEIASRHIDSEGRPPCYTFFYPQEEYGPELLEPLAEMTRMGIGDVDVHIHHDGEGEQNFVDRMAGFVETLRDRHGLLRDHGGRTVFGFIHGNWALDNARPDGRWCGLDNEITLLKQLGCYADFTLPAVPDPSQAGPVNVIFSATDDPRRPRSHERGKPVVAGSQHSGDLMLIPGPLAFNWHGRPLWKPRIETGELAGRYPPSRQRARLWLSIAPRIGSDVFVKLFTHGAQERNSTSLLGGDLDRLLEALAAECASHDIRLHFVSAWNMWRAVMALLEEKDPVAAVLASGSTP